MHWDPTLCPCIIEEVFTPHNAGFPKHFRYLPSVRDFSKELEARARETTAKELLAPNQSRLRKSYSMHTALACILNDIRQAMDEGDVTLLLSVDQSRAFNLVNIPLLVEKLRAMDFSDSACRWVESFLVDHS
ncbi:hypothetical protein TSAR_008501 [Trichomalopsis sarcophagae]|uniref:Uncharacterized protein n=1 Tax=Trichomalopsis sarcophagae TaxID=543379 RepID=A0A232EXV6_9HYME|nr:hypothetical protein TSAR_008501 [Trichomalopsis sarcophagae]